MKNPKKAAYTNAQLVKEIEVLYERECLQKKRAVAKAWLREAIIAKHNRILGRDRAYAMVCVHEHVEDVVEQVTRRYRIKSSPDQPMLPGYEYIQPAYMIERDGESVTVPTELCTASELREKAKECRAMGAGLYAHADELERLATEREGREAHANGKGA